MPGASFSSWGYKILLNTAFTKYKKTRRTQDHTAYLEQDAYEALPDVSSDIRAEREMRDYVLSLITRMPHALGRVLRLHFLEDRSQKEIADMEGVSITAVKTRIHRAKKEFRKLVPDASL